MAKTKLSSKGQIVIPGPVRDAHRWRAGMEFEVEEHADGILLRPVRRGESRIEDVLGCTGYRGPAKTIEEMDRAVAQEARRRGRS